jgi:mono/diheme cytochrome c family protein
MIRCHESVEHLCVAPNGRGTHQNDVIAAGNGCESGARPMKKAISIMSVIAGLALLAAAIPAYPADTAAGQKTFEGTCAACHQFKSYAGKSEAELQTDLQGIVGGTIKHPKKLTLSATDIANVSAYIFANEPK